MNEWLNILRKSLQARKSHHHHQVQYNDRRHPLLGVSVWDDKNIKNIKWALTVSKRNQWDICPSPTLMIRHIGCRLASGPCLMPDRDLQCLCTSWNWFFKQIDLDWRPVGGVQYREAVELPEKFVNTRIDKWREIIALNRQGTQQHTWIAYSNSTLHASEHRVHKLHQRYILKKMMPPVAYTLHCRHPWQHGVHRHTEEPIFVVQTSSRW